MTDGNLNYDSLPGDAIAIAGYVYSGTAKTTPLANAPVDIWQTDNSGAYWPESNGPASGYTAEQLSLRGHVVTDANGYYRFTTIFPGEYEGRARHIHIRATSADSNQDVITQLIMSKEGDQTPAAADDIARSLPECHTMRFATIEGTATAFFDVHLSGPCHDTGPSFCAAPSSRPHRRRRIRRQNLEGPLRRDGAR